MLRQRSRQTQLKFDAACGFFAGVFVAPASKSTACQSRLFRKYTYNARFHSSLPELCGVCAQTFQPALLGFVVGVSYFELGHHHVLFELED